MCLLLAEPSFQVVFQDLHDRDEPLHFRKAAAELSLASSSTRETRLRLGQPIAEVFDHGRVVGGRRGGPGGGVKVVSG